MKRGLPFVLLVGLIALGVVTVPAAPGTAPAARPAVAGDPVGWLQGYLRIDTTNPPGNEAAAVAYLAAILHRHGVPTRTLVTADGRASLYARVEGRRDDEGLLLVHHVDVVEAGGEWRRPPFSGDLVGGELWGRGAIDVKSLGIAHLAAFLAVARADRPPERDVAFLAVADEESGGLAGTGWLLERHPGLFTGIAAVYGEGGANRAAGGRARWWGVEVAQKRPLWLTVRSRGRGGHASGINPHSASHRMIAALARLIDMPLRWRVSEPVRGYLAALAPLHEGVMRRNFLDPDAWVGPDGPRGPMLPGQPNLFLDTVQVTRIDVGERINVVPEEAMAHVDVRLLPDTDADRFLAGVRRALGDEAAVEVEVLLAAPPAPPSPVDHRAYRAAAEVLADEAPVVPAFIAGFTDSRWFRERGIPTYGVSPFALDGTVLSGIHGSDERIPVAELERGIERMTRIVLAYAEGGEPAGDGGPAPR
ncbi:MAG TPA: M20/M25/M40 family metallo-hydrolase [Thermoanaerobaculia bacterium]|nr:M20/M25/M40 family metallo-hydrolase [Thermoanaerobaculia bacterium]